MLNCVKHDWAMSVERHHYSCSYSSKTMMNSKRKAIKRIRNRCPVTITLLFLTSTKRILYNEMDIVFRSIRKRAEAKEAKYLPKNPVKSITYDFSVLLSRDLSLSLSPSVCFRRRHHHRRLVLLLFISLNKHFINVSFCLTTCQSNALWKEKWYSGCSSRSHVQEEHIRVKNQESEEKQVFSC